MDFNNGRDVVHGDLDSDIDDEIVRYEYVMNITFRLVFDFLVQFVIECSFDLCANAVLLRCWNVCGYL